MILENIDIKFLIIPISILLLLIVISGIQTLLNIKKVNKVKKFIETEKLETAKTTKAYYSSMGLKKDLPSYPSKLIFSVSSDEILIYGYSNFPFLFKTYYQPLILSTNIKTTETKLNIGKIIKPKTLTIKDNRHVKFKFTDNFLIPTSVEYDIDFEK